MDQENNNKALKSGVWYTIANFLIKKMVITSVLLALSTAIPSVILVVKMQNKLMGRILGAVISFALIGLVFYVFFIIKARKISVYYWLYAIPICLSYIPHVLLLTLLNSIDRVMINRWGVASIKVGDGVKSEGNLIISGTKGYIYVPAPWWKTDYFEVRYEDRSKNKRYFYQLDGEGIRYELMSFARGIEWNRVPGGIESQITCAIAEIMDNFKMKRNMVTIS